MTPSKTLFCLAVFFVAGIGIASGMYATLPEYAKNRVTYFLLGFFVIGIVAIIFSFLHKKYYITIIGFCLLFLVLGVLRFQIFEFTIANDPLRMFNDFPEKVAIIGFIAGEPDIRNNLQKLLISTEKLVINGQEAPVQGKLLITVGNFSEAHYHYLDQVKLVGKLKTPPAFEEFNYKNYLLKEGIYSVMDYPAVQLLAKKHSYTPITYGYEKILWLKSKLIASIDQYLFPPHSFILKGMVFGSDKEMPKDLKDQFNVTGLSHVTAASGSNIVVLISLCTTFLLFLGFWRGQAFYLAVAFIAVYIALIGFPASGVRAAIMGCIALLAQKLGRQNTTRRILVLAAALMLLQNPLLLIYDVGFQLSFLASLGIIHIKPLIMFFAFMPFGRKTNGDDRPKITSKHKSLPARAGAFLLDIIAVTISAQIITLPIILYDFGRISLVSLVTNLLALPVVGVLTVLGFLLSIFASILPVLGFIFAVPCWFLLAYFLKILEIFSQSWAAKTISDISLVWVVIYYAALSAIIKFSKKYHKFLRF